MMALYEGYRFLVRKQIWTCHSVTTDAAPGELVWRCFSDSGEIRNYGLSQIAIYPQVISPGDRPSTGGDPWRSM